MFQLRLLSGSLRQPFFTSARYPSTRIFSRTTQLRSVFTPTSSLDSLRVQPTSRILQLIRSRGFATHRDIPSFGQRLNSLNNTRYSPNRSRRPGGFRAWLDNLPQGVLVWTIVGANLAVFFFWYSAVANYRARDPRGINFMYQHFTSSFRNAFQRPWTLITSVFSHKDLAHIAFNMLTFYFMAPPVMSILGHSQFMLLYLGGGVLANIASLAWYRVVKHREIPSLGASGAISSVLAVLACAAPRMTFLIYGFIPVPAWLAVGGYFVYDSYSAIYDKQLGTNTSAHVAGLLAGVAYFLARRGRIGRIGY